jgi:Domain of unknown function (DUF4337)
LARFGHSRSDEKRYNLQSPNPDEGSGTTDRAGAAQHCAMRAADQISNSGGTFVPETPEVETDNLDEKIHEELERAGGSLLKAIALSTALFAAFAAVAALRAGSTVNEALVLKTEATRLQGEASDNWAAYQAKGIKSAVQQASESSWIALGKQPPSSFADERQRYAREQVAIAQVAREKEAERDKKSAEADHLMHQHHRFANSVALFQVAIALGAVAALTRVRPVWYASILVGVVGAVLFIATRV